MARALIIAAIVLLSSTAVAQNVCGPRDDIIARLWDKWQEKQVAVGLINDNRLVEVFVSEEGGWTIIISEITGRSCVASAGKNWTTDGFEIPGKGM